MADAVLTKNLLTVHCPACGLKTVKNIVNKGRGG